jgi:hypothetical protein
LNLLETVFIAPLKRLAHLFSQSEEKVVPEEDINDPINLLRNTADDYEGSDDFAYRTLRRYQLVEKRRRAIGVMPVLVGAILGGLVLLALVEIATYSTQPSEAELQDRAATLTEIEDFPELTPGGPDPLPMP